MKSTQKIFSQRFSELRTEKRYTQTQLAEILGVKKQTVNNWEHERALPALDLAVRLADVLGTSLDYLTGFSADPRVHKPTKKE